MKRILSLLVVAMSCMLAATAEDGFVKKQYVVNGDTLLYNELTPLKSQVNGKMPLVVFLHGAGERGNDNELQLTHGSQMWLNPVNRRKFPCYVIFPQCPEGKTWAYEKLETRNPAEMPINDEPTDMIKFVRGLIKKYVKEGNVDPERVYVIGLSMGGMAVYDIVSRYPDMFAAAVPICGTLNPKILDKYDSLAMREVKFFIFHGDADAVVPVEGSRAAYEKLREMKVPVDYTEFVGCTHGSWNPAFNSPDFMRNIFRCHRSIPEKR